MVWNDRRVRRTVLIVDDHADFRAVARAVLERAGLAVVGEVATGSEAIAAVGRLEPEIVLLDIQLPDQDGFDLIRQVRALGHHAKDLPAVALTAFAQQNDQRQALLAGFQIHVSKPADPHDLTAAIASLAGRTGPAA